MTTAPTDLAPVRLEFPRRPDDPIDPLLEREWLVTNGLGGYASGTIVGANTRRYHGLLVPHLPAPLGRTMMLPFLDEALQVDNRLLRLGTLELSDGQWLESAWRSLTVFELEWQIPVWTYRVEAWTIRKRLTMPNYQNTVYVEYELLDGPPIRFIVRPFVSFRQHDGPLQHPSEWPFTLTASHSRYEIEPFPGAPKLRLGLRPRAGIFIVADDVIRGALYRVERARGYDYVEELQSPGYFVADLKPGEPVALFASTEPWDALNFDSRAVFDAEQERCRHVLARAPDAAHEGLPASLVLAADQFVTLPASRVDEQIHARAIGDEARTIIAGYHWFTDWGRDTMISLEGLTLCTGRAAEARAILLTFSHYVNDGLLPNLFPEGQRTPLYNTVDATFWFFHAIDRYHQLTGDDETLRTLLPVLASIIDHHIAGTHFGIHMDPADALISASSEGYQLTWMDAKFQDWIVTPRRGKPVEIQALWHNALCLMAHWSTHIEQSPERYDQLAQRARASFNARFWLSDRGYLQDVIDGPDGDDPRLRPNQLFSVSLRFPILDEQRWKSVVDVLAARLLTPFGLRTLDPADPDYKPRYDGSLRERDGAYHQGLVWPWLIGHFVDAWRKVYPGQDSRPLLQAFEGHLRDAGVGSISEIFDAEAPFTPRGCISQAWSVAEVLRAWLAGAAAGSP